MTALIDNLLQLGSAPLRRGDWVDYIGQLGLAAEHIPELIEIMLDASLAELDEADPRSYAPIHAIRALGQLRDATAIEAIIRAIDEADDNDWFYDDGPTALGLIGTAAIPAVERYIFQQGKDSGTIIAAVTALQEIAENHVEARGEVLAILERLLGQAEKNDPAANGFVIASLLDLKAVESLPVIERAYADDMVDLTITGDYDDVLFELGLGDMPPRRNLHILEMQRAARLLGMDYDFGDPYTDFNDEGFGPLTHHPLASTGPQKKNVKKKTKRKQSDKSRKRNRKK